MHSGSQLKVFFYGLIWLINYVHVKDIPATVLCIMELSRWPNPIYLGAYGGGLITTLACYIFGIEAHRHEPVIITLFMWSVASLHIIIFCKLVSGMVIVFLFGKCLHLLCYECKISRIYNIFKGLKHCQGMLGLLHLLEMLWNSIMKMEQLWFTGEVV